LLNHFPLTACDVIVSAGQGKATPPLNHPPTEHHEPMPANQPNIKQHHNIERNTEQKAFVFGAKEHVWTFWRGFGGCGAP